MFLQACSKTKGLIMICRGRKHPNNALFSFHFCPNDIEYFLLSVLIVLKARLQCCSSDLLGLEVSKPEF